MRGPLRFSFSLFLREGAGRERLAVATRRAPGGFMLRRFFVLFRSLGALGSHLGALGSHLVAKLARNGAKMGGNSPT